MTANATPPLSIPDTPDGFDRLAQKARSNMRRYDNCTQSDLFRFDRKSLDWGQTPVEVL
jgi:hypothetical protein